MKPILYILCLAFLTSEIFSQTDFDYQLSKSLIQTGEVFTLTVSFPIEAKINDKLLTESKVFALVDKKENQNKTIKTIEYKLTSLEVGEHSLPPLEIQVGPQSFSTHSKKLTVQTTRDAKDESLRPSLPMESPGIPFLKIFVTLVLAAGLYSLYKKHKETLRNLFKKENKKETPPFNLGEWLNHELKKIFAEYQKNPNLLLADKINHLIKNFLELQKSQPVLSLTTSEIKTLFKNLEINSLLSTTDYFKYSQDTPKEIVEFQNNLFQNTKKELIKCLNS
jgi:hypothetical protein